MKLSEYNIDLSKVGRDTPKEYYHINNLDLIGLVYKLTNPRELKLRGYNIPRGLFGFFSSMGDSEWVTDRGDRDFREKVKLHERMHRANWTSKEETVRLYTGTQTPRISPEMDYSSGCYN